MVDPMADFSQWLHFCSRREHPSGHRTGGEKGADRAREIVVAKHNGRVVELDGDMEGPSLHLVHERLPTGEAGIDRYLLGQREDK